jgi:hypothetical protein
MLRESFSRDRTRKAGIQMAMFGLIIVKDSPSTQQLIGRMFLQKRTLHSKRG